ncbi:unnamed protein product, partial [marine sediment metagenome]
KDDGVSFPLRDGKCKIFMIDKNKQKYYYYQYYILLEV